MEKRSAASMSDGEKEQQISSLTEALHVGGPADGQEEGLMLFGQFVGAWELECTRTKGDGEVRMLGELYFGWVLGGRAVQDIWIVPGRGQPGEGQPPFAFHGTTIRFYDKAIHAWRSTWVDPVNGRVRRFTGRLRDGNIVLLSYEDTPQLRWTFSDIQHDSFTWVGEISTDDGLTWEVEEVMQASRIQNGA